MSERELDGCVSFFFSFLFLFCFCSSFLSFSLSGLGLLARVSSRLFLLHLVFPYARVVVSLLEFLPYSSFFFLLPHPSLWRCQNVCTAVEGGRLLALPMVPRRGGGAAVRLVTALWRLSECSRGRGRATLTPRHAPASFLLWLLLKALTRSSGETR